MNSQARCAEINHGEEESRQSIESKMSTEPRQAERQRQANRLRRGEEMSHRGRKRNRRDQETSSVDNAGRRSGPPNNEGDHAEREQN
jgi:hypothetical protein